MDTDQIITYATTYPSSVGVGAAGGLLIAALAGSTCCCCYILAPGSVRRITWNFFNSCENGLNNVFGSCLPKYHSGNATRRVKRKSPKEQGFDRLTENAQEPGEASTDQFTQGDIELGEIEVDQSRTPRSSFSDTGNGSVF